MRKTELSSSLKYLPQITDPEHEPHPHDLQRQLLNQIICGTSTLMTMRWVFGGVFGGDFGGVFGGVFSGVLQCCFLSSCYLLDSHNLYFLTKCLIKSQFR